MTFRRRALVAILTVLLSITTIAQGPPPVVRGVIAALTHDSITVKTPDAKPETIPFAADWTVSVLRPIGIEAIQPGSFIGTAEVPQKDGTGRSLEVHVFPPGVKAGEGHYALDTHSGSMMTNGTVGKVTSSPKGRELVVSYPTGERHIVVPQNVPVMQITNGDRVALKPGLPALLILSRRPDGTLAVSSVSITANGAPPPM